MTDDGTSHPAASLPPVDQEPAARPVDSAHRVCPYPAPPAAAPTSRSC
ncbi:hypothetical protein [Streptomyces sp. NPDC051286]